MVNNGGKVQSRSETHLASVSFIVPPTEDLKQQKLIDRNQSFRGRLREGAEGGRGGAKSYTGHGGYCNPESDRELDANEKCINMRGDMISTRGVVGGVTGGATGGAYLKFRGNIEN